VIKLDNKWTETTIDINSVDWQGKLIHLSGVKALKSVRTGKIRVYPYNVAQAEIRDIASRHGLIPRDVALLLMLLAKPGPFKEGEVIYKYHLNKLLFYQWKELEMTGYHDALPRDEFEAYPRGPVPKNLADDLKRLQEKGLIETRRKQWGKSEIQASVRTVLTDNGLKVAKEVWEEVPDPVKLITLKVKERIFPLDPATVRDRVHREYPEYRKTYTQLDEE
jgi:DNA-binding PadR family transcriptional regulator